MAKKVNRCVGLDDEMATARLERLSVFAAQADDGGSKYWPQPKPPLFTPYADYVDFNNVTVGQYAPASFYSALGGADIVHLPVDQAAADALGYDATKIFNGENGNDYIGGGALNDLILGDAGNDILYGKAGDDGLAGGLGNDRLYGDVGKDIILLGTGIDYVEGGAGKDIIVAKDIDESLLSPGAYANVSAQVGKIYRDTIRAGDGGDIIFASNSDAVDGGAGNDVISLISDDAKDFGITVGGNGSDTITGSAGDEWIATGEELLWASLGNWNAASKAAYGGAADVVTSGGGDDTVITMLYCDATVDTGKGKDDVFVRGLLDIVATGDGSDRLYLHGGATKADLGADNDYLILSRAAYDNPNHSEITLGAGNDRIHVRTDEWFTNGDKQLMGGAPVVLDFDLAADVIDHIWVTNLDDASQSMNADYFKCIDLFDGSALLYDDPFNNSKDFVVARFNGINAQELQAHIDLNTAFL
jgi:Ca2+-binding RTX toxin-like protein